MATTRPRITITLTERQYELVKTLSDSSGQSMSGFIVEYLELAQPVLESMCVAYQRIKQADTARKQELKNSIEAAERSIRPLVESVNAQVDFFFSNVDQNGLSGAEGAGNAHAAPDASESPLTNRGVTNLTKDKKTVLQAAPNKEPSKKIKK